MTETGLFRLFVYGTLKRGFPARERFLSETEATEAAVRGEIFALSEGYPAVAVPESDVLAVGTGDFHSDLLRQSEVWNSDENGFDGSLVRGEIVEIRDAQTIRDLDAYEGFDPDHPSAGLYRRVLIPALTPDRSPTAVWAYVMDEPDGDHLPDGIWSGS